MKEREGTRLEVNSKHDEKRKPRKQASEHGACLGPRHSQVGYL